MIDQLALISAVLLILVWGLYPALVGLLALFRRRPEAAPASWPAVSVVIATREPEEAILERIRDVLCTQYPLDRLEVIVSSGREIPESQIENLGERGARVRSVVSDGPGKALTLNAGVRAASGDVVVFADTYQRFDEDTIPRLVGALERPGVGAASGSLQLAPGTGSIVRMYWAFERWLRGAEARLHSAVGATGAVWAIRRSLWRPLRAGLILDDVFGPMNVVLAGQRVTFVDSAMAWEMRTPTPAQEYRRKVRTLTGVLQLCAWLPAVLVPIRNPIWLQFVFHKLLRMLTPYILMVMAIWLLSSVLDMASPATLVAGSVAGGAALFWVLFARRRWAVRIRSLAYEGVLIQFAVLVAGANGLRGNWRVWDA